MNLIQIKETIILMKIFLNKIIAKNKYKIKLKINNYLNKKELNLNKNLSYLSNILSKHQLKKLLHLPSQPNQNKSTPLKLIKMENFLKLSPFKSLKKQLHQVMMMMMKMRKMMEMMMMMMKMISMMS
jgi:hypothetical protein